MEGQPYLGEQLIGRLGSAELSIYLTDIFSKLKEVVLILQGKQLTVFIASDQFKLKTKLRILENMSQPLWAWQLPHALKTFPDEIDGDISEYGSFDTGWRDV